MSLNWFKRKAVWPYRGDQTYELDQLLEARKLAAYRWPVRSY